MDPRAGESQWSDGGSFRSRRSQRITIGGDKGRDISMRVAERRRGWVQSRVSPADAMRRNSDVGGDELGHIGWVRLRSMESRLAEEEKQRLQALKRKKRKSLRVAKGALLRSPSAEAAGGDLLLAPVQRSHVRKVESDDTSDTLVQKLVEEEMECLLHTPTTDEDEDSDTLSSTSVEWSMEDESELKQLMAKDARLRVGTFNDISGGRKEAIASVLDGPAARSFKIIAMGEEAESDHREDGGAGVPGVVSGSQMARTGSEPILSGMASEEEDRGAMLTGMEMGTSPAKEEWMEGPAFVIPGIEDASNGHDAASHGGMGDGIDFTFEQFLQHLSSENAGEDGFDVLHDITRSEFEQLMSDEFEIQYDETQRDASRDDGATNDGDEGDDEDDPFDINSYLKDVDDATDAMAPDEHDDDDDNPRCSIPLEYRCTLEKEEEVEEERAEQPPRRAPPSRFRPPSMRSIPHILPRSDISGQRDPDLASSDPLELMRSSSLPPSAFSSTYSQSAPSSPAMSHSAGRGAKSESSPAPKAESSSPSVPAAEKPAVPPKPKYYIEGSGKASQKPKKVIMEPHFMTEQNRRLKEEQELLKRKKGVKKAMPVAPVAIQQPVAMYQMVAFGTPEMAFGAGASNMKQYGYKEQYDERQQMIRKQQQQMMMRQMYMMKMQQLHAQRERAAQERRVAQYRAQMGMGESGKSVSHKSSSSSAPSESGATSGGAGASRGGGGHSGRGAAAGRGNPSARRR